MANRDSIERRTTTYVPPVTERREIETSVTDPYAPRRTIVWKAQEVVYLVFGAIETLIAIRLILALLGANPQAEFARTIYAITSGMVAPFAGLFRNPTLGGGVLELESAIAIIVYALVGSAIATLIWILLGETRRGVWRRSRDVETSVR